MSTEVLTIDKLKKISLHDRQNALKQFLRSCFKTHLNVSDEDFLDDMSFFYLGLKSLAAVEIKYLIEKELQIKLLATTLFDFPTINKLCEYLQKHKLIEFFQDLLKCENIASESETEKMGKKLLNQYFNLEI